MGRASLTGLDGLGEPGEQVALEAGVLELPGGYPSPERARVLESMRAVPLPVDEGSEVRA